MQFLLIGDDGLPTKWPITSGDLKGLYPNVSFPKDIPAEGFEQFGILPLIEHPVPSFDPAREKVIDQEPEFIGGSWHQQWRVVPLTAAETESAAATTAQSVRTDRNKRLSDCDWTQLPDAPVDATAWATYRQALRDVTAQDGFPWNVQWPPEPTT